MKEILASLTYRPAALFAGHALRLCPRVCLLQSLGFLEAGNPKGEAGRSRLYVLNGGKLAYVHLFRNRLPMMHRSGWNGNEAGPRAAYAWFVWNVAYEGPTELIRISWEAASRGAERRSLHVRERPGGEDGPGSARRGAT